MNGEMVKFFGERKLGYFGLLLLQTSDYGCDTGCRNCLLVLKFNETKQHSVAVSVFHRAA